jgi:hypothetical protein
VFSTDVESKPVFEQVKGTEMKLGGGAKKGRVTDKL